MITPLTSRRNHLGRGRLAQVVLLLFASGALGSAAAAQDAPPAPTAADSTAIAGVVRAVLSYRLYYMADSTPVATCMLLDAMHGTTDDPAASLPAALSALLDMPITHCGPKPTPTRPGRDRGHFAIRSIDVQDSVAIVHSSAGHGEYIHSEEYLVRRRDRVWFVLQVTLNQNYQVLRR